jgi:ribosomal protein S10
MVPNTQRSCWKVYAYNRMIDVKCTSAQFVRIVMKLTYEENLIVLTCFERGVL